MRTLRALAIAALVFAGSSLGGFVAQYHNVVVGSSPSVTLYGLEAALASTPATGNGSAFIADGTTICVSGTFGLCVPTTSTTFTLACTTTGTTDCYTIAAPTSGTGSSLDVDGPIDAEGAVSHETTTLMVGNVTTDAVNNFTTSTATQGGTFTANTSGASAASTTYQSNDSANCNTATTNFLFDWVNQAGTEAAHITCKGDVIAANNFTATSGNITSSAGNITATAGNIIDTANNILAKGVTVGTGGVLTGNAAATSTTGWIGMIGVGHAGGIYQSIPCATSTPTATFSNTNGGSLTCRFAGYGATGTWVLNFAWTYATGDAPACIVNDRTQPPTAEFSCTTTTTAATVKAYTDVLGATTTTDSLDVTIIGNGN